MKIPLQLQALPTYAGGKGKLCPWIFGQLAAQLPHADYSKLTFIDAFSGGGSVSMRAKLQGFGHVKSNDMSNRSQLVLSGLIANSHQRLPLAQALQMATHEDDGDGFVQRQYGGSVFSVRHAAALDRASHYIQSVPDPVLQAQLRLILWRYTLRFVSFATSVGTSNRPFAEALDGQRSFATLNPKRFRDGSIDQLLAPCWSGLEKQVRVVNQGIFPAAGQISTYQADVFELLPRISGDILYLDPPYAKTMGYGKSNEVLDAVLFGQHPASPTESVFTRRVEAISELLDVSRHIPVWVLSYNDKVVDLDTLQQLVAHVDPGRQVSGYAREYAHMPHVAKRTNQELLIIASK